MKKSLAVLALIFVAMTFAGGASAQTTDSAVVEFLTSFKFVKESEINGMDEYLTRGEFVKFASRIINGAEQVSFNEQYFDDVPTTHESFNSIMLLRDLGCINGVAEKKFAPDELIKTEHALSVVCKILGGAQLPDSAKMVLLPGLMKSVSAEAYLTKENAFDILCNALFSSSCLCSYEGTATYTFDENKLYMETEFNIYVVQGIVSDNGFASIYGESKIQNDQIVINNMTFRDEVDGDSYLGYMVWAYYKQYDDETVVYHIQESRNDIAVLNPEFIEKFENNTYTFLNENGKEGKYNLSSDYKLIYNKKAIPNDNDLTQEQFNELMKPKYGEIVLIDNNNDGEYDICKIFSYETVVVSGYSEDTHTLINILDEPKTMSFENYDEIKITDVNGATRNFLSLQKYDVLSIARSVDNTYAEIIISNKRVEGSVKSYGLDSNIKLVIDNIEYTIVEESNSYFPANIVGKQVTLLLNHNGDVVYNIDLAKKQGIYAYVIDAVYDDYDDVVYLVVNTEDNSYRRLKLAKRVTIDEIPLKNAQDQYDAIMNANCGIGYVAIINANSDNEISKIDFPAKAENSTEHEWQIAEGMDNADIGFSDNMIGSRKLAVKVATPGFFVPTGGQRERYYVGLATAFSKTYDANRRITVYVNDKNSMYAEAVVLKSESNGLYDMSLSDSTRVVDEVVVSGISTVVCDDGEVGTKIEYITKSAHKDVIYEGTDPVCRWTGNKLQVGDLIKFGTDRKTGRILQGQLVIMYSPEEDEGNFESLYYDSGVQTNGQGNKYNKITAQEARLIYGWVYEKGDEYIRLAYRKNPLTQTIATEDKYLFPLSSLNCIVYDSSNEKEKVRIGNHSDITGYIDSMNASQVVLKVYQGSWIYVIK